MPEFLTLQEAAAALKISKWTIYSNGPAQYGGIKLGALWRFPVDRLGRPTDEKKTIERESNVYQRRYPPKGSSSTKAR